MDSVDGLEAAFLEARARRNEGLMVKDPDSRYSPGRRGLGWLKMKKALATLDCVVVGVEVGHGKRHGVLSDYTFAVRDDETGDLVTIGKAYSGLTDAEIAEMTRWFEAHTLRTYGRYRAVEPTVVVEVAFDVIMRSARHKSGFALRFPRIAQPANGQAGLGDRHAGHGHPPVRGTAARRRAPGDGEREALAPPSYAARNRGRARGRFTEARMYSMFGDENRVELVLYTDALVTRGRVRTGQHRITDILNHSDDAFIILEDVTVEELGHRGETTKADYAQVNLDAVLFAVSNAEVPVMAELRTPKHASEAIISVPPFKIVGTIHLLPTENDLRQALVELTGALPAGDRRDLLVGHAGRGAPDGPPGRGEPPAGADPGSAQGGRPVGGDRLAAGAAPGRAALAARPRLRPDPA